MNYLNELKIKNAKKKSRELILLSTSHGLSNVFRSKRISMKVMWFFLFTASSSFGVSMVIRSIFQYLQFEVVTKIDIINESPTEFPTITFFNLKHSKCSYHDTKMSRSFQVNFASSYFVVVIVLDLEGIVQLQDDRPGSDVDDPRFAVVTVVADVRVLDVVVTVVGDDQVEEDEETREPRESEVESGKHFDWKWSILGFF